MKRALKELVEEGFIQKEARSRAYNRGQSSDLYTRMLLTQAPTPDNDNALDYEDSKDGLTEKTTNATSTTVTHICFATMQTGKQKQAPETTA